MDFPADFLSVLSAHTPRLGIVLGSGMSQALKGFRVIHSLSFEEIPGFPRATVPGHEGRFYLLESGGRCFLVQKGRPHYYEGYSAEQIAMPVLAMQQAGIRDLLLFNAAGSVNPDLNPGDLVSISGHLFYPSRLLPLESSEQLSRREIWSETGMQKLQKASALSGIPLRRGVYQYMSGPSYETPAEVRAAGKMGADMLGMSTVPEAIIASSMGISCAGISVISNYAAGIQLHKLSHEEVSETLSTRTDELNRFISFLPDAFS